MSGKLKVITTHSVSIEWNTGFEYGTKEYDMITERVVGFSKRLSYGGDLEFSISSYDDWMSVSGEDLKAVWSEALRIRTAIQLMGARIV